MYINVHINLSDKCVFHGVYTATCSTTYIKNYSKTINKTHRLDFFFNFSPIKTHHLPMSITSEILQFDYKWLQWATEGIK